MRHTTVVLELARDPFTFYHAIDNLRHIAFVAAQSLAELCSWIRRFPVSAGASSPDRC